MVFRFCVSIVKEKITINVYTADFENEGDYFFCWLYGPFKGTFLEDQDFFDP
jgi:hypothetical protein